MANALDAAPDRAPRSVEQLEQLLSEPTAEVVEAMAAVTGDLVFLGVGGKMGPTLARMARRASDAAGVERRVIGVSRFSRPAIRNRLEAWGIETHACDLLDAAAVEQLPQAETVVFMGGMKFGTSDSPALTWAMNCLVPAHVGRRYAGCRTVAFSTGNVYGYSPVDGHGSPVDEPPDPRGEYAMSALGRERMFQYFSDRDASPLALLRLNYATELRYGVLVDLAQAVRDERPIDVSMGHVNVLWLADANAMALRALPHAASPARIFNVAGPEILAVADVCRQFGKWFGQQPRLTGTPAPEALLNDGRAAYPLLGDPRVDADRMIRWSADWVGRGGESLGKPTHFGVRDGRF